MILCVLVFRTQRRNERGLAGAVGGAERAQLLTRKFLRRNKSNKN